MKSIALMFAAGLALFSPYVLADDIYVAVEGSRSGRFVGELPGQKGLENKFQAVGYEYDVKSPRDIATGQASGKRMHGAIKITKRVGASSPQFFSAVVQNEILKSVTIDIIGVGVDGQRFLAYQILLANASVSEIRQHWQQLPSTKADALVEEISVSYQHITVKYPPLNGSATDTTQ